MLTNEQLTFILLVYDAECLYEPDLDESGEQYFINAKRSYWARKMLREHLLNSGVTLPRPSSQPSPELEKLVEKFYPRDQRMNDLTHQPPDELDKI